MDVYFLLDRLFEGKSYYNLEVGAIVTRQYELIYEQSIGPSVDVTQGH